MGDVKLVIDGILSVMEERLEEGDVIQLGRLGNFRMVAGSKGVENEADFNTSFSIQGAYRLLAGDHADAGEKECHIRTSRPGPGR